MQKPQTARNAPNMLGALGGVARRRITLIFATACFVMFLLRLGDMPLASPNEGLYALAAREMLETGEWIVPHINTVVYFEKPPLLYWLVALSMQLFGVNAFAARLPSALSGVAVALTVYALGRRLRLTRPTDDLAASDPAAAGAYPAMVVAMSLGFVVMARLVMFDALTTALATGALAAFWFATADGNALRSGEDRSSRARLWVYAMYFLLGLAVLAKGFFTPGLFLLIVVAYTAITRRWARLRRLVSAGGVALFLAVVVPWHLAAALRHQEFVWFYFVNEHLLRFLGTRHPRDFPVAPVYIPALGVLLLTLPWSALLLAALGRAREIWRRTVAARPEITFVLCWLLVPLTIFTISSSRHFYYVLPTVPAVALLVGGLWNDASRRGRSGPSWSLLAPLTLFSLVVAAAWAWCLTESLDKSERGARFGAALGAGTWLVGGFLASTVAAALKRAPAAFACLGLGAMMMFVWTALAPNRGDLSASEKPLAEAVASLAGERPAVVVIEDRLEHHSAFVFHLPPRLRPVLMVEGRTGGDLEFGSQSPSAQRLFLTHTQFEQLCHQYASAAKSSSAPLLFYLTDDPPRFAVPESLQCIRRDEGAALWTMRPAR